MGITMFFTSIGIHSLKRVRPLKPHPRTVLLLFELRERREEITERFNPKIISAFRRFQMRRRTMARTRRILSVSIFARGKDWRALFLFLLRCLSASPDWPARNERALYILHFSPSPPFVSLYNSSSLDDAARGGRWKERTNERKGEGEERRRERKFCPSDVDLCGWRCERRRRRQRGGGGEKGTKKKKKKKKERGRLWALSSLLRASLSSLKVGARPFPAEENALTSARRCFPRLLRGQRA